MAIFRDGWNAIERGQVLCVLPSQLRGLRHTVYPPQNINSRYLGMVVQSERVFVFCYREEFDVALGEPRRLDKLRFPMVPMKRKLLPISEVLRRRGECKIAIVPGSFQAYVVQNRASGPMRIGSVEFASTKSDGTPRVGARITLSAFKQVWRVLAVFQDGR